MTANKQTSTDVPYLSQAKPFGALTRQWNAQARSMAELTPWLFGLTPSVVCNKDSALLAVYEVDGLDVDSATQGAINDLSQKLEFALSTLMEAPVPLTLWFQARRLRSLAWPKSQFSDAMSQRLDDLRHKSYLENPQYTNTHYLSILMQPPQGLNNIGAKLAALTKDAGDGRNAVSRLLQSIRDAITGDATREFKYSAIELAEAIQLFEKILAGFEASVLHLNFRRLAGDELAGHLSSCTDMCPHAETPLRGLAPAYRSSSQTMDDAVQGVGEGIPRFLDTRLPNASITTLGDAGDGKTLLFESGATARFARVLSITDFPVGAESFPTQLDGLLYVGGELVVTTVFRCMPKTQAMKLAESAKRYHNNRKFSFKQLLNAAANKGETGHLRENTARADAAEDAAQVHDRLSMGLDMIGYAYSHVVALGNSMQEVKQTGEQVERTLNNARYGSITEGIHALSAWTASLPGMYGLIMRWLPMSVANIADIAPVRTVSIGHTHSKWLSDQTGTLQPAACLLTTDLGTPYWFDFFANGPGHGMLVGPSGAGKSILGGFLTTMLRRYQGAQVIVMDKDWSLRIPIVLQGGVYSDLSVHSKQAMTLNPLALLTQGEEHLPWVTQWLELLLTQQGTPMSTADRLDLQTALRSLIPSNPTAKAKPTDQEPSPKKKKASEIPTLSRLFAILQASAMKEQLRQWVRSEKGVLSAYFDNPTDAFEISAVQGFEMGAILQNDHLAAPFTEYLFYRIELHLKTMRSAGQVAPMMIYLSEVWHLLKNPSYAAKIVDWLKTLRKYSAVVWMDTQSLEDLAQSSAFAALRDNIPNKLFLPNFEAQSTAAKLMYTGEFQLTAEQVERVVQAIPKRQYLLRQANVARMLDMSFSRDELAILRSDNRAQAALDSALRAKEQGDLDWRDVYFDAIK